MNEDLPKEWNNPKVRQEIIASSAHIGATLEQMNKILQSRTLDLYIEWLRWLNRIALEQK